MADSLCKFCQSIFTGRDFSKDHLTEEFPRAYLEVEEASKHGCRLCARIHSISSQDEHEHTRTSIAGQTTAPEREPGYEENISHHISFTFYNFFEDFPALALISTNWSQSDGNLSFDFLPVTDASTLLQAENISRSTCGPQALAMARNWLDLCNNSHSTCQHTFPAFVPTRLIDTGCPGTSLPRLVELSSSPGIIQYVALSHCWGDRAPFMLLESNFKCMKELIPTENLSKTLKDAIDVVRALGMRYLWADTICIIQDSNVDWQHEALRMGEVYRDSACTIAATAAADGNIGLSFERNINTIKPCAIKIREYDGPKNCLVWESFRFSREVMQGKLNTRACALQELLLSPRTLHFTKEQIF